MYIVQYIKIKDSLTSAVHQVFTSLANTLDTPTLPSSHLSLVDGSPLEHATRRSPNIKVTSPTTSVHCAPALSPGINHNDYPRLPGTYYTEHLQSGRNKISDHGKIKWSWNRGFTSYNVYRDSVYKTFGSEMLWFDCLWISCLWLVIYVLMTHEGNIIK